MGLFTCVYGQWGKFKLNRAIYVLFQIYLVQKCENANLFGINVHISDQNNARIYSTSFWWTTTSRLFGLSIVAAVYFYKDIGKNHWACPIDLTDYSLLPNGLVFMSNTYSCFVLSWFENYFAIELKNSKKQIRPGKHRNIIFICPWHAKIS